jgi:PAS domain S-box-containing protein
MSDESIRSAANPVVDGGIWQQVINLTHDIAYIVSPEGLYLDVNPQLCRVFRQPREKVVGTRYSTHLDRDNAVMAERILREIVARRAPERSTRTFQLPGVDPQTYEVMESPLIREGKVWAVAGIGREISQEIVLERKLWDTVENRHAAVDFALRTSLGLVKGYVYTLGQNHAMDESRRTRYVTIIEDEIDHLAKIIEDMLDVRRMESGDYEIERDIVDLSESIHIAVQQCAEDADRREIQVKETIPDNLNPLYVAREALTRIMLNLVQNAIQHTLHSGAVDVTVEDHEAYVEVMVRDNGVGIPENELPFVFDKYYRGKSSAASPVQGTGLGLAITRTLVEALGGRIWVSSQIGSGTEFRVVLPRRPISSGEVSETEFWKASSAETETPSTT